jgi:hypothetical protein
MPINKNNNLGGTIKPFVKSSDRNGGEIVVKKPEMGMRIVYLHLP